MLFIFYTKAECNIWRSHCCTDLLFSLYSVQFMSIPSMSMLLSLNGNWVFIGILGCFGSVPVHVHQWMWCLSSLCSSVTTCYHLCHLWDMWTSRPYGIVQNEAVYCSVKPYCGVMMCCFPSFDCIDCIFVLTVHLPDMAFDGYLTIYTVMLYCALYCLYYFSASPYLLESWWSIHVQIYVHLLLCITIYMHPSVCLLVHTYVYMCPHMFFFSFFGIYMLFDMQLCII